jgi:hypothetical protein
MGRGKEEESEVLDGADIGLEATVLHEGSGQGRDP